MGKTWSKANVQPWRSYVPPCRPSRFDLDLCTAVARTLRAADRRRRLRTLILGSTTEFRDWAFEEYCDVTVVDSSLSFHKGISVDLRYKAAKSSLVIHQWETYVRDDYFDIILGDLVIGNIAYGKIPRFLHNIQRSLRTGGIFVTKNIIDMQSRIPTLYQVMRHYERYCKTEDPFPHLVYFLARDSVDSKSRLLKFSKMWGALLRAKEKHWISNSTFDRFRALKWDDGGKIEYYMIERSIWEQMLLRYFQGFEKYIGPYVWSENVPTYVTKKIKQ